jgi:hypothetical protein
VAAKRSKSKISRDRLKDLIEDGAKVKVPPKATKPAGEKAAPPPVVVEQNVEKIAQALAIVAESNQISQQGLADTMRDIAKEVKGGSKIVSLNVNRKPDSATGIPLIDSIDFVYE